MKPSDVRLPYHYKTFQANRWYWAIVQDNGLYTFPSVPDDYKMKKLYTVPGGQPDCFKLEKM